MEREKMRLLYFYSLNKKIFDELALDVYKRQTRNYEIV